MNGTSVLEQYFPMDLSNFGMAHSCQNQFVCHSENMIEVQPEAVKRSYHMVIVAEKRLISLF